MKIFIMLTDFKKMFGNVLCPSFHTVMSVILVNFSLTYFSAKFIFILREMTYFAHFVYPRHPPQKQTKMPTGQPVHQISLRCAKLACANVNNTTILPLLQLKQNNYSPLKMLTDTTKYFRNTAAQHPRLQRLAAVWCSPQRASEGF